MQFKTRVISSYKTKGFVQYSRLVRNVGGLREMNVERENDSWRKQEFALM